MLIERIKQNYEDFTNAKQNYLPINDVGDFNQWFPGLMRGDLTCVTGTPNSSKTPLVKSIVVHQGIEWAVRNKVDYHVIYFGLEESEIQFNYSLLSYQAYKMYNLRYNIRSFEFIGAKVEPKDFDKLEKAEERVTRMLKKITYVPSVYNSFGIYKTIRNFAASRGSFYNKGVKLTDEQLKVKPEWDKYIPDNPDEFIVVVLDHLLLIEKQKDEESVHQAIWNTVEYLRRYACKHFNYSVIVIQHQDNTTENQSARLREEVLPTQSQLGKNKEVARSYMNVLGVTNLNRTNSLGNNTGIQMWDGHKIRDLGNYSRCLNIIKNRFGIVDKNCLVYFDGRVGHFKTLPPKDSQLYKDFINYIKTLE